MLNKVWLYPDGTIRAFYGGKDLELKKLRRVQDDQREELKAAPTSLSGLKTNFVQGAFFKQKIL